MEYGVQAMPTFIFFKNGEKVSVVANGDHSLKTDFQG